MWGHLAVQDRLRPMGAIVPGVAQTAEVAEVEGELLSISRTQQGSNSPE